MIKNWKSFNENINRGLEILTQIENGNELYHFLKGERFKNYEAKLDFANFIYISNGNYGLVFTYKNDNHVYKLTFDKNSYLLSRKLIGKKYNHLVEIIDVDVISSNNTSLYLIKMEKLKEIPIVIDTIFSELHHKINLFIKNAGDDFDGRLFPNENEKERLLEMYIENLWEEDKISDMDLKYLKRINFISQISEMKKELQSTGLIKQNLDIHHNNVMMKGEDICIIDFIYPKEKFK